MFFLPDFPDFFFPLMYVNAIITVRDFPRLLKFTNCDRSPPLCLLIRNSQIEKIWKKMSPIRTALSSIGNFKKKADGQDKDKGKGFRVKQGKANTSTALRRGTQHRHPILYSEHQMGTFCESVGGSTLLWAFDSRIWSSLTIKLLLNILLLA